MTQVSGRISVRLSHLLVAACALGAPVLARAQTPPTVWPQWIASLQAQGYTVSQGSALEFTTQYCLKNIYPYFGYCFASDPEDPYLAAIVPIGNGYVDPFYGPTASQKLSNGTLAASAYHLDPTEAVVAVITLPPLAAYFSYETYVFTRPAADYPNGVTQLSPDPSRADLFASFGNSIDNVQIKAQSGLDFGQGIVGVITTSNSALANALVSSFPASGGSPNDLFVEPVSSITNPGLDQTTDDFTSVMRYSIPQDNTAGNNWRKNIAANVQIYRIGAPAGQSVVRFGQIPLRAKHYNADESNHNATLTELSTILGTWLAGYENKPTVTAHAMRTGEKVSSKGVILSGYAGPLCIANGVNCTSDEQDTVYGSYSIGPLAANQLFIAAGVNHTVTNNSTFVEISASDARLSTGVAGASQTNPPAAGFSTGVLTGSAQAVLQDLGLINQASKKLQADLPNLYVHLFSRPCGSAVFCSKTYTSILTTSALPTTDGVRSVERAYVLPGYYNSANSYYTVEPDVIY